MARVYRGQAQLGVWRQWEAMGQAVSVDLGWLPDFRCLRAATSGQGTEDGEDTLCFLKRTTTVRLKPKCQGHYDEPHAIQLMRQHDFMLFFAIA